MKEAENAASAGHHPGPGFVVLYRWKLHAGMEAQFVDAWSGRSADLLVKGGSLGSRLHEGADGVWYGYAQWPSADVRERAFAEVPGEPSAAGRMREAVAEAYPELVLRSVADFIVPVDAAAKRGPSDPTRGLLLFAHGARDARWALPFEAVAARVQACSASTPVVLAFLEFMAPGLIDAGTRLAAAGCQRVDVVPLFLGAGGHVRKDLPLLLDELRQLHTAVDWRLRPAIGEVDAVVGAMADAALSALAAD